jgi:electron transport complex protein RnfG
MAKKESTLINMTITLLLVTLLSSTTLGFVYKFTYNPIQQAENSKKTMAIQKVLPEGFDNNPFEDAIKIESESDSLILYPAKKNGEIIAGAVETYSKNGFSGMIKLMAGFENDGTIHSIAVLSHSETPGLGDKISKGKSDFGLQFEGQNPENFKLQVKKDQGDIDAITASTISSRAYCEAVELAWKAFMNYKNNK